ncbi:MAG: isoprenylcysteine carboxylmethyltransferase family protein [Fibrobacter sp.]|jgi:protein-S-isoprenylcysteine O-methyltransferase Ste14|nr:isoprenylcysteine carboxylmethyltransferase family protein [Fibrobacter sp.]
MDRKNSEKQLNPFLRNAITGLYIFAFWILLPILLAKISLSLDRKGLKKSFPWFIKTGGTLISLISAFMLYLSIRDFSRGAGKLPITAIPPYDQIASKGVYSIWRHPVYLFYILLAAGIALIAGSGGFLLVVLPLFSILCFIHAKIEEIWLLKKHGDVYRAYLKRTSLVCPKIRSLIQPPKSPDGGL